MAVYNLLQGTGALHFFIVYKGNIGLEDPHILIHTRKLDLPIALPYWLLQPDYRKRK
jgi:hypothetical protein